MKDAQMPNPAGWDRRSFLKLSGLATAGAALAPSVESESSAVSMPETATGAKTATAENRLELVNVLQGTDSCMRFSRGNTLPLAALPFGMAHWTIQSHANTSWMFQPDERRVQGFRCTHQLSPWLADYGEAVF
jgi:putative alpha-1,2-mannosidase